MQTIFTCLIHFLIDVLLQEVILKSDILKPSERSVFEVWFQVVKIPDNMTVCRTLQNSRVVYTLIHFFSLLFNEEGDRMSRSHFNTFF